MQAIKEKRGAWLLLFLCIALAWAMAWCAAAPEPNEASAMSMHALPETSSALSAQPSTQPTAQEPTQPTTQEPPPTRHALHFFDLQDPLLLLVNRTHPLPEGYAPELSQIGNSDRYIATLAYDALQQMLKAGRAEGLYFHIASAYRANEVQKQLFEEDVRRYMARGMSYEEAYAATARYTMLPGCSEHESGLAVDIVAVQNQNLDDSQRNTAEMQWLNAHCHEFGFILRYPEDKTEITGIAHESWHYRYVGKRAAQYITDNGLTLEEFRDLLRGFAE